MFFNQSKNIFLKYRSIEGRENEGTHITGRLVAPKYRPHLVVHVVSERVVRILADPVHVTTRQLGADHEELFGHGQTSETGIEPERRIMATLGC